MALYMYITAPSLTVTTNALTQENAPAFRYCSYPGERVLKFVSFDVNGNPLDRYTREVYNFFREYCVTPEKQPGWDKLMGQESSNEGFLRQPGINRTAPVTTAGLATTGLSNTGLAPVSYRVSMNVFNGNQTPKQNPNDLELLIPLLFWFNLDPRLSVPSVSIPYGQRFITMDLAQQSDLMGLVPRGTGTWTSPNGTLGTATITNIQLYINNIFVNPEVHDIFIRRIGFTLIRVHRIQQNTNVTSDGELLLSQFKWPCETIFVGMKVAQYETNTIALDRWHLFCTDTISAYSLPSMPGVGGTAFTGTAFTVSNAGVVAGTATTFVTDGVVPGSLVNIDGFQGVVLANPAPTNAAFTIFPAPTNAIAGTNAGQLLNQPQVEAAQMSANFSQLSVRAHGIPLYFEFQNIFYNAYQPFTFGSHNVQTPKDPGSVMINFSLYPKTYQPSGHINISRAREFYINWLVNAANISTATPGNQYFLAVAINFLLISDGSAVLRYST